MSSGGSSTIDLSRLPAPQVIEALDFEAIVAASIADLQQRWPEYDTPFESDPAVKLLQAAAYRELITRARINDAARSTMLAFATAADLEQIGARLNVVRRLIQPATQTTPAVYESDAELRARIQLAPEALPYAGITAAGYRARALALAPSVKDVAALKRGGGKVDVVLLGRDGDGTVADDVIATVATAFRDDDAVQLTDIVSVRGAAIMPYDATISLQIGRGPDPAVVVAEAENAVRAYAAQRDLIGRTVYTRGLEAAAKVGDVEQAIAQTSAAGDVIPGATGVAWLRTLTITSEVL